MRKRYFWDRALQTWVDVPPRAPQSGIHIIRDEMEPATHMADGKHYTSKAAYRATTRAHGMIEIGNERQTDGRRFDLPPLGHDIARVIEQLSS